MNGDVEELLRDGLDRLTADVRLPAGMAARACARRRRRKIAARTALACGTAAVTAVAVIVVAGQGAQPDSSVTGVRTTAYVVRRVEGALAAENRVIAGQATGSMTFSVHNRRVRDVNDDLTSSWAYGERNRTVEFTGSGCGHAGPGGACTHRGGSEPYWAQGTALVSGKLVSAYVTYYDHRYSVSPLGHDHLKACSRTAQLVLGGPAVTMPDWPAFIKAMLGCEAAVVTGHARVAGVPATVISGSIDVPLSKGYARTVRESRVRVRYTLDVDSATYLPVRVYGSTETYGGADGPTIASYVTSVRWLPATKANIAKALVTIPAGYQRWKGSSANQ